MLTFKDKFNQAAENNKISRKDQVEKLREVLTGNALNHLPEDGIKNIDQAWDYLDQAFGNPHTCLNHRLAKVKGMPGMTDNMERANPAYTADWYLKMENAVNSVLRMGARNQSLEYAAFNDKTIYGITSKLPWRLERQAYETNINKSIYGKEKLTKVLELIKKASYHKWRKPHHVTRPTKGAANPLESNTYLLDGTLQGWNAHLPYARIQCQG